MLEQSLLREKDLEEKVVKLEKMMADMFQQEENTLRLDHRLADSRKAILSCS